MSFGDNASPDESPAAGRSRAESGVPPTSQTVPVIVDKTAVEDIETSAGDSAQSPLDVDICDEPPKQVDLPQTDDASQLIVPSSPSTIDEPGLIQPTRVSKQPSQQRLARKSSEEDSIELRGQSSHSMRNSSHYPSGMSHTVLQANSSHYFEMFNVANLAQMLPPVPSQMMVSKSCSIPTHLSH